MRTTVTVADPLLENAKLIAEQRGITLSEVIEDALREHLNATDGGRIPPFVLHTAKGRLVDPRLDLDRTSALTSADDETAFRMSGAK